jgi:hypothetical protein
MSWTKQNANFYTHDQAPFSISLINGTWFLIDNRDQSKGIPFEDIYNNPVWNLNLGNQSILASHFRGEGLNTPSTPAHSFKTEISSGLYRESAGVLAFSVLGNKVLEINSKPSFLCKAWVNFNGTGTVAIRASGNVSSITDNGTGDYTINFMEALPDANYSFSTSNQQDDTGAYSAQNYITTIGNGSGLIATTSLRARSYVSSSNTSVDVSIFTLAVFR